MKTNSSLDMGFLKSRKIKTVSSKNALKGITYFIPKDYNNNPNILSVKKIGKVCRDYSDK